MGAACPGPPESPYQEVQQVTEAFANVTYRSCTLWCMLAQLADIVQPRRSAGLFSVLGNAIASASWARVYTQQASILHAAIPLASTHLVVSTPWLQVVFSGVIGGVIGALGAFWSAILVMRRHDRSAYTDCKLDLAERLVSQLHLMRHTLLISTATATDAKQAVLDALTEHALAAAFAIRLRGRSQ